MVAHIGDKETCGGVVQGSLGVGLGVEGDVSEPASKKGVKMRSSEESTPTLDVLATQVNVGDTGEHAGDVVGEGLGWQVAEVQALLVKRGGVDGLTSARSTGCARRAASTDILASKADVT
jgi:hypothetical protein